MTFLPECGADISDCNIATHLWIHNDSMYVRFGGIRNTKTWSKSNVPKIWEKSNAKITIRLKRG